MKKIIEWFINLYAIWIILAFIVGYLYPGAFMWFTKGSWMTLALAGRYAQYGTYTSG